MHEESSVNDIDVAKFHSYEHVTVFLRSGNTLRFHKVTEYASNGFIANFKYISESDGKQNIATLYLEQIVMIAGVPNDL